MWRWKEQLWTQQALGLPGSAAVPGLCTQALPLQFQKWTRRKDCGQTGRCRILWGGSSFTQALGHTRSVDTELEMGWIMTFLCGQHDSKEENLKTQNKPTTNHR